MKRIVLLWSLSVAIVASASSQPIPGTTPEAWALHEVLRARNPTDDTTNDPKWRASLATALHRYCESVMALVPRNTPQEDRWVDDEFKDINAAPLPTPSMNMDLKKVGEGTNRRSARLKRLLGSVEYARQSLRQLLGGCSRLTNQLIGSKSVSPAAETLLWAELSRYFIVEDDLWDMAEIVGIVSPKYCKHFNSRQIPDIDSFSMTSGHDENYICSWQSVGIMITLGAVIPLLKESANR